MQIPNICIKNKKDMNKLNNSRYTNQNKRDISIIPTSIKYLPVVLFWKTSFDFMNQFEENNNNKILELDRKRSTWLYNTKNDIDTNYCTMKKKISGEESNYV